MVRRTGQATHGQPTRLGAPAYPGVTFTPPPHCNHGQVTRAGAPANGPANGIAEPDAASPLDPDRNR